MFEFKETKEFMDAVHGYISIPKPFVDNLIDTVYFQRLRNIDQTGMRIVFPNGKHDRFGHSLGVFYLGSRAVDALLTNFRKDKYWNISSDNTNNLFWAKNKVLFLIACLIHDIGHVPFSHSLENLVYNNTNNQYNTSNSDAHSFTHKLVNLINTFEERDGNSKIKEYNISAAPHEQFGAGIVLEKLKENIDKIFNSLILEGYPNSDRNDFLYAEHLDQKLTIEPLSNKDLCFIARMIIGLPYDEYMPEYQIRNCFIELLNGSNFDVDKLDYVLRDTQMSGMSNISIDVQRLLESICVVTQTVFLNYSGKDDRRFEGHTIHSIQSKEEIDVNTSQRNKEKILEIDGNIKGIFFINSDVQITIKSGSTLSSLRGYEDDNLVIRFASDLDSQFLFDSGSIIQKNGNLIEALTDDPSIKSLRNLDNNASFKCKIENVTETKNDISFIAEGKGYIELNGKCNIIFKTSNETNFGSITSLVLDKKAKISGDVDKIVALGNLIEYNVPNQDTYNSFKIGYRKQSMNLLANVLEARDYLYLWCYAHHKVIYYANFLIPSLAQEIVDYNSKTKLKGMFKTLMPTYCLTYEALDHIDDSYVWTILNYLKRGNQLSNDAKKLLDELFTHRYKNGLWKSLSEYDLLFESFDDNQQLNIRNYFANNLDNDRFRTFKKIPHPIKNTKDVDNNDCSGGYINQTLLNKIKNLDSTFDDLLDIVFVDAGYVQKSLSSHNTFIMINNEFIPMDRMPLLSSRIGKSNLTAQYFYLYYETISGKKFSNDVADSLRILLKSFLENEIKNC